MLEMTKALGQYFTPPEVARTLVGWVIRSPTDSLLDPSCGTGEFLVQHGQSVGVELSHEVRQSAILRAPHAHVVSEDFFVWAGQTRERFDAIVGNPPFIRYQEFHGTRRALALEQSQYQGVRFSGLTSSWAPFLVVAAGLLKVGGRLGFVVPAEIGHSTYAAPLLKYLTGNFEHVHVIALKEKIFPKLAEDAWLLYADGFGGKTNYLAFTRNESFSPSPRPPKPTTTISVVQLSHSRYRLRRFLLPAAQLDEYDEYAARIDIPKLGDIARTGIGYVTGDNAFFHLSPSEARKLQIPAGLLKVSIRNGQQLKNGEVSWRQVEQWLEEDREVLLLDLNQVESIPHSVQTYLNSAEGIKARTAYKCRTRQPWYAVPDVFAPDAFITYMNGLEPSLILNEAKCVCTNSLLAVRLIKRIDPAAMVQAWQHPLARLSQEIEGHPLGGGMLKLEPGEASRVLLPLGDVPLSDTSGLHDSIRLMRHWRHQTAND